MEETGGAVRPGAMDGVIGLSRIEGSSRNAKHDQRITSAASMTRKKAVLQTTAQTGQRPSCSTDPATEKLTQGQPGKMLRFLAWGSVRRMLPSLWRIHGGAVGEDQSQDETTRVEIDGVRLRGRNLAWVPQQCVVTNQSGKEPVAMGTAWHRFRDAGVAVMQGGMACQETGAARLLKILVM